MPLKCGFLPSLHTVAVSFGWFSAACQHGFTIRRRKKIGTPPKHTAVQNALWATRPKGRCYGVLEPRRNQKRLGLSRLASFQTGTGLATALHTLREIRAPFGIFALPPNFDLK